MLLHLLLTLIFFFLQIAPIIVGLRYFDFSFPYISNDFNLLVNVLSLYI